MAAFKNANRSIVDKYLEEQFKQAGYCFDADSIKRIILYALITSYIFGLSISFQYSLILPLACFVVGFILLKTKSNVIKRNHKDDYDEACYSLSRYIRSGQTLENAIMLLSEENKYGFFNRLNKNIQSGYSLEQAISKISGAQSSPFENILFASLLVASNTGGSSSGIFDRIGDSFHQDNSLKDDLETSMAQVKISTIVISLLPIAMVFISSLTGTNSISFLFTNPFGLLCLVIGISLEVSGLLWIKRITSKVFRK
ncbi:MAG: type II secretion system F family protein [Acidimicrobiia bacterium]